MLPYAGSGRPSVGLTPQTFLANAQPTTMFRPTCQDQEKAQDEIAQLSHELSVELPKEICRRSRARDLSENAE